MNHGPGSAGIAWTEIEDTAVDHGMITPVGESIRVTANRISRHAQLLPNQQAQLRQVVLATEKLWFGAGTAPDVAAAAEARIAVVAAVIAGLRRHEPLPLRHRIMSSSHRKPSAATPQRAPAEKSIDGRRSSGRRLSWPT